MLKYAFKSLGVKKVKALLLMISIVISSCVALLAYNISGQINDGIIKTAAHYDIIIGPSGSATQLAMNTLFFTETPLGTIPYEVVTELKESGMCNSVVPFCMGDSYNSARIVGTVPGFLSDKSLSKGELFGEDEEYTCVLGYDTAKKNGVSVGDKIITSHGIANVGEEHAASPLTVVGILSRTKTAYDNAVFTSYKTVWAIHESEEHGEEHGDEHEEEEGEAEAKAGSVCAVLVKSKSLNDSYKLTEIYGDDSSKLIINPTSVLREVLKNIDTSKQIVSILCVIIVIMNIFIIVVITLLNMYDSEKEISLMRLIGISMKRINFIFIMQNAFTGFVSALASIVVSRLCLVLLSSYSASMGIVLDALKLYPAEVLIAVGVFLLSVIPTVIITYSMSRRDAI